MKLIGPTSLTHYILKDYGKNIYLFGERHHVTFICEGGGSQKIDEFLVDNIRNTKGKVIDLFIESPYLSSNFSDTRYDTENLNGPLTDLYRRFKPCLITDKHKCPYTHLRVHSSDVRDYQVESMIVFKKKFRDIMMTFEAGISDPLSILDWFADLKEETKYYSELPLETFWQLVNDSKGSKQLNAIGDRRVRQTIRTTVNEQFEKLQEKIRTITHELDIKWKNWVDIRQDELRFPNEEAYSIFSDEWMIRSDDEFKELALLTDILYRTITGIYALPMDVYLISRIFRFAEITNVIIYAGGIHIRLYKKILHKLRGQLLYEKDAVILSSKEVECLDISDLPQPLFAKT